MCRRVQCTKCDKPTWEGCGQHIEQALAGVPLDERCQCPRDRVQHQQQAAPGCYEAAKSQQ